MKRILIAAAVAASAVLPVGLAAPAHASDDVHIRVDPVDWTWSGTINVGGGPTCDAGGCTDEAPLVSKSFTVGPGGGLQDIVVQSISAFDKLWGDRNASVNVTITDNVFSGGGLTRKGTSLLIEVVDPMVWDMSAGLIGEYGEDGSGEPNPDDMRIQYNFGEPGGVYELKFYPPIGVPSAQNLKSAANFNVDSPTGMRFPPVNPISQPESGSALAVSPADADVAATPRSKNAGYETRNPERVTAMAKRFVAAPGDVINIHGYGPDRDVALARAEHVRDHLLAEITRLGGDPDAYPTFVVYAGDPAHKKGVHVTVHQHAASTSAVTEGGTRTMGGTS